MHRRARLWPAEHDAKGKQPILHPQILTERYLSTINQMGPRQATLLTLEYMSFCGSV